MRRALLLLAVSCGGEDAPCTDVDSACIAVRVSSPAIEEIDQLEVDMLIAEQHSVTTIQPAGGGTIDLPFETGIRIASAVEKPVGIVAAGKLAGVTLGTAAASVTVLPGEHIAVELVLAPPAVCVAGAYYCGGDKVAGDPDTLYQCNGGGVPLARGRCTHSCEVRPTEDDVCLGGPERCVDGGYYCGGNELAGDPSTLYRCLNGEPTAPRECESGCVVAPAGTDDHCR